MLSDERSRAAGIIKQSRMEDLTVSSSLAVLLTLQLLKLLLDSSFTRVTVDVCVLSWS